VDVDRGGRRTLPRTRGDRLPLSRRPVVPASVAGSLSEAPDPGLLSAVRPSARFPVRSYPRTGRGPCRGRVAAGADHLRYGDEGRHRRGTADVPVTPVERAAVRVQPDRLSAGPFGDRRRGRPAVPGMPLTDVDPEGGEILVSLHGTAPEVDSRGDRTAGSYARRRRAGYERRSPHTNRSRRRACQPAGDVRRTLPGQ
jgi:hypothetical protein